jgi:hypothetical protein
MRRYGLAVCVLGLAWAGFVAFVPGARRHLLPGAVFPAHDSASHLVWAAGLAALTFTALALVGKRFVSTASRLALARVAVVGMLVGYLLFSSAFGVACLLERDGPRTLISPGSWIMGAGGACMVAPALGVELWGAALALALLSVWFLHRFSPGPSERNS